ncbi:hypothetical protein AAFN47_20390 [Hoeflea sp. CAU 1731]
MLEVDVVEHRRLDLHEAELIRTLDGCGWDGGEIHIEAGGLGSGMRLYAMPETMRETRLDIERLITTPKGAERRLYVRVQQEDGQRA